MASYKEYKCEGCGYTVAANPKGKDMVMMGETETFLCPDCKEIVDVLYPHGEKPEKVVCPDCGGDHIAHGDRSRESQHIVAPNRKFSLLRLLAV